MFSPIAQLFSNVKFGEPATYENLTVVPILTKVRNKVKYLPLSDAIKNNSIEITEVNESGSVPVLRAINKSDKIVLILDGEQLIGAKQNRILNASILLNANSETFINVSCVEQGRWSYKSKLFYDSPNMLKHAIRAKKIKDVNRSLLFSKTFSADQGGIWDSVATYSRQASVNSPTSSMEDVFTKDKVILEQFETNFTWQKGQNGVVVFINGHSVGFEFISDSSVFKKNFSKLIRSYSSEAMYKKEKIKKTNYPEAAIKFIKEIETSKENIFKSDGLGDDCRFESDKILASALVHENEVIHFVGFKPEKVVKAKDKDWRIIM
jgi:hypothetical protein